MMKRPKSIFRYPGGKLKAIKYIKPFWEAAKHSEYREPFVGGGSVFISKPLAQFNWINDIDTDMTSFYSVISNQKSREKLISELKKIEINKKNYDYFLDKWKFYIPSVAETFAYSLLVNHFHALIKVKTGVLMHKNKTG